jgi:hypothetical protein
MQGHKGRNINAGAYRQRYNTGVKGRKEFLVSGTYRKQIENNGLDLNGGNVSQGTSETLPALTKSLYRGTLSVLT